MMTTRAKQLWPGGSSAAREKGPIAAAIALLVFLGLFASAASAQDVKTYTRQTFDQWLEKNVNAKPDFKPGDVLTNKDIERMRPFIPPGYLEQLDFPDFKATVIAPVDHTPRKDYQDCSAKHQNQTQLKSDGSMQNYVCGQPFLNSQITAGDPQAGMKAAWNFDHRWQNFGFLMSGGYATWDRFDGGTHTPVEYQQPPQEWTQAANLSASIGPTDTREIYGGGGTFQRSLGSFYSRVYYTDLAQMQDQGGTLPVSDAKDFFWKEFTGFFSPFDIRGTVFIVYRYADPTRADDAWAYIPNLRRVRRISAEVKSDSLLGTDHTIEDFYSFSGRPLEWNWKFLGWKDVLGVVDSKYDYSHLYGPKGIIPNDVWSLRRYAVIERTPKDPRHPYSSVVMFWDAQNWDAWLSFAWDKKGKLWKAWEFQKKWSETFEAPALAAINKGTNNTNFQSIQVLDLQNDRGTIWICPGGYPTVDPKKVAALYDINKLEEIHR
jgi:hypothetical protein